MTFFFGVHLILGFWGVNWTSKDAMTFHYICLRLHLILGGKLDVGGRDGLFFNPH